MTTIVSKITDVDGSINIKNIIDKHFTAIKKYGNKIGWPVHVGVVHDEKTGYKIADVKEQNGDKILCQSIVTENHNKENIVAELSSEINFLV